MELIRVEVVVGPTPLAYHFAKTAQGTVLQVYVGEAVADAPIDARRGDIAEGFKRFMIGDTQPCLAHGGDDLCWQSPTFAGGELLKVGGE